MTNKNTPDWMKRGKMTPSPFFKKQGIVVKNLIADVLNGSKSWILEIDIWNTTIVYWIDNGDIYIYGRKIYNLHKGWKTVKALWSELIENHWDSIIDIIKEREWLSNIKNLIKFMANHGWFHYSSNYPIIHE